MTQVEVAVPAAPQDEEQPAPSLPANEKFSGSQQGVTGSEERNGAASPMASFITSSVQRHQKRKASDPSHHQQQQQQQQDSAPCDENNVSQHEAYNHPVSTATSSQSLSSPALSTLSPGFHSHSQPMHAGPQIMSGTTRINHHAQPLPSTSAAQPGFTSPPSTSAAATGSDPHALPHREVLAQVAYHGALPGWPADTTIANGQQHPDGLGPVHSSGSSGLYQDDDDEDEQEGEEDEEEEFDPLLFMKSLPPLEDCVSRWRTPLLPRQTRTCARKTLVLDLDETLVHSSLDLTDRCDFSFPVLFNATEHMVHVRRRPHLDTFMTRVAELFEVVIFTASQKVYAERLLNIIDPTHNLVKHRIYRDSCVIVEGNYLKDLSALGRDLTQTLIVDNSPQAFGFQVDNGVPIESWYEDQDDDELLKMLPFLESLVHVEDVRPHIREKFRLQEQIAQAGSNRALYAFAPLVQQQQQQQPQQQQQQQQQTQQTQAQ
ncbi:MAG: hypothetical protein WDW36_001342 [Sanguina aurantia]